MSHRFWLSFVGSLGGLSLVTLTMVAEAPAQNIRENNRFDRFAQPNDVHDAAVPAVGFRANGEPESDFISPAATTEPPDSFDRLEDRSRAWPRQPDLRRQDSATAVITDVQEQAARSWGTPSSVTPSNHEVAPPSDADGVFVVGNARTQEPARSELRLAQNHGSPNVGSLPEMSQNSSPQAASRASPAVTPQDVDAAYLDRDFRTTRTTSLIGDHSAIPGSQASQRSVNSEVAVPLGAGGRAFDVASAAINGNRGDNSPGSLPDVDSPSSSELPTSTSRPVPLWLTLGLFISLPANFFFGWVAMSMHMRYQDLLADLDASESRLLRESRRRRRFFDFGESDFRGGLPEEEQPR